MRISIVLLFTLSVLMGCQYATERNSTSEGYEKQYSDNTYRSINTGLKGFVASMNSSGTVVDFHAIDEVGKTKYGTFVWSESKGIVVVDLNTKEYESHPVDISDDGYVLGFRDDYKQLQQYLWSESTGIVKLSDLGLNAKGVRVKGINGNGEIVGSRYSQGSKEKPYIYNVQTGGETEIDEEFVAYDRFLKRNGGFRARKGSVMNSVGGVAIETTNPSLYIGFWSEATGLKFADIKKGSVYYSWQKDINDNDLIVGRLADMAGDWPFKWQPGEEVQILPDFGGNEARGWANAINNSGQIVGHVEDPAGQYSIPAMWDNGIIFDLNDSVQDNSERIFRYAIDINDSGQILVVDRNIYIHLLSPIVN